MERMEMHCSFLKASHYQTLQIRLGKEEQKERKKQMKSKQAKQTQRKFKPSVSHFDTEV